MGTIEILSLVGIVLGIAILIFCAYRRINILLYSILASVVVLAFSGQWPWQGITGVFMSGFAEYVRQYMLLFITSTLFSFMLAESGATTVIATSIMKLVNKAKTPVGKAFAAVLALGVIQAILIIGGVNAIVYVFMLTGIARDLFKKMNIPWHLAYLSIWGGGSTVACFIPGIAQVNNIIPNQVWGTSLMSLPGITLITFAFAMVLTLIYSYFVIKKSINSGEGFFPTGTKLDERYPERQTTEEEGVKKPFIVRLGKLLLALLPLIVMFVVLNLGVSPSLSMLVGCLAVVIFHFKTYKPKQIFKDVEKAVPVGISVVANFCAIVGFGAVVSSTPFYTWLVSNIETVITGATAGPSTLWILVGSISVACGITATAAGGLQIVLGKLGGVFAASGWSLPVLHRLSVMTTGVFDSLPHSAAIMNGFQVFCVDHKMVYKYVFVETVLITGLATVLATFLCSLGLAF